MIAANAWLWFLIATLPIAFWVAWSEMARMKIPNMAVLALLDVYVIVGLLVLPFSEYLGRYLHFVVVLVLGFVITSIGLAGAGDSKFAAAMAPFIALHDAATFLYLLAGIAVASFVAHRLVRQIGPIRNLAPDWESWHREKDFPMGLALSASSVAYLALGAFGRL